MLEEMTREDFVKYITDVLTEGDCAKAKLQLDEYREHYGDDIELTQLSVCISLVEASINHDDVLIESVLKEHHFTGAMSYFLVEGCKQLLETGKINEVQSLLTSHREKIGEDNHQIETLYLGVSFASTIINKDHQRLEEILKNGQAKEIEESFVHKAYFHAIDEGDLNSFKLLLENFSVFDLTIKFYGSLIVNSVDSGRIDMIKALLQCRPSDELFDLPEYTQAIRYAVEAPNQEATILLMDALKNSGHQGHQLDSNVRMLLRNIACTGENLALIVLLTRAAEFNLTVNLDLEDMPDPYLRSSYLGNIKGALDKGHVNTAVTLLRFADLYHLPVASYCAQLIDTLSAKSRCEDLSAVQEFSSTLAMSEDREKEYAHSVIKAFNLAAERGDYRVVACLMLPFVDTRRGLYSLLDREVERLSRPRDLPGSNWYISPYHGEQESRSKAFGCDLDAVFRAINLAIQDVDSTHEALDCLKKITDWYFALMGTNLLLDCVKFGYGDTAYSLHRILDFSLDLQSCDKFKDDLMLAAISHHDVASGKLLLDNFGVELLSDTGVVNAIFASDDIGFFQVILNFCINRKETSAEMFASADAVFLEALQRKRYAIVNFILQNPDKFPGSIAPTNIIKAFNRVDALGALIRIAEYARDNEIDLQMVNSDSLVDTLNSYMSCRSYRSCRVNSGPLVGTFDFCNRSTSSAVKWLVQFANHQGVNLSGVKDYPMIVDDINYDYMTVLVSAMILMKALNGPGVGWVLKTILQKAFYQPNPGCDLVYDEYHDVCEAADYLHHEWRQDVSQHQDTERELSFKGLVFATRQCQRVNCWETLLSLDSLQKEQNQSQKPPNDVAGIKLFEVYGNEQDQMKLQALNEVMVVLSSHDFSVGFTRGIRIDGKLYSKSAVEIINHIKGLHVQDISVDKRFDSAYHKIQVCLKDKTEATSFLSIFPNRTENTVGLYTKVLEIMKTAKSSCEATLERLSSC